MVNNTFLNSVDTNKVNQLLNETHDNSKYFNTITDDVVRSYTYELDDYMVKIRMDLSKGNVTDTKLEEYILTLSNMLYFLGEKLENVGIKGDIAKAAKQEVYNKAYLNNDVEIELDSGKKIKPTKDANQAVAEEKSKYENVVYNIYDRVYKIVKYKIDAANECLGSLKKVLTRRMQEIDLSKNSIRTNSFTNSTIENENTDTNVKRNNYYF